jgi:hypothetical protein
MDKYYYFVAQLPMLAVDKETYLSTDIFLAEARKWLTLADSKIIQALNFHGSQLKSEDPTVLRAYKQFELTLRSEVAEWRRARKKRQDYKISAFPPALIREVNPLQAEKNLLLLRWQFLSELELEHFFDLSYIIIFFLKLQILEQLQKFDQDKGLEKYHQLTEIGTEAHE